MPTACLPSPIIAVRHPQAGELIGEVMGNLRYNLLKLDPSIQCRVMRPFRNITGISCSGGT
jgi:hypothetical protein